MEAKSDTASCSRETWNIIGGAVISPVRDTLHLSWNAGYPSNSDTAPRKQGLHMPVVGTQNVRGEVGGGRLRGLGRSLAEAMSDESEEAISRTSGTHSCKQQYGSQSITVFML